MIWSTIKSDIQLISKRHCSFVELMDGTIYIFGGFDSNNLDKIKTYDINSNEWGCLETRGTISLSNKSCFSSVCWQNNFYILGGEEKLRISGDVYSLCLGNIFLSVLKR